MAAHTNTTNTYKVDADTLRQVVKNAIQKMEEYYIFPEIASKASQMFSTKLTSGAYTQLDDPIQLSQQLTHDIREVTQDLHARITYHPDPLPEKANDTEWPTPEEMMRYQREAETNNFGILRVEQLPVNIGYIDLWLFEDAEFASESFAAAMMLVAYTNALVVDLRKNRGGDPATVAFMISYLLDKQVHLNSMYHRQEDRTNQSWTHSWVPGKRYGSQKPVYVLTSGKTFSAGEEFAYNLKHLQRATLVGETTGGGANPGRSHPVAKHFSIFVPDGRPIHPITNTNWESVGVEPDVRVAAEKALEVAQLLALKTIQSHEQPPVDLITLQNRIAELEKEVSLPELS